MPTFRGVVSLAGLLACNGDEPHDCDAGTPTCESSLVVLMPDPRATFELTLDDGTVAMTIVCPDAGASYPEGYTVTCGGGRVTIETNVPFGDDVEVRLEDLPPETHTPDYQQGGDFCGNPCTIGTIQL